MSLAAWFRWDVGRLFKYLLYLFEDLRFHTINLFSQLEICLFLPSTYISYDFSFSFSGRVWSAAGRSWPTIIQTKLTQSACFVILHEGCMDICIKTFSNLRNHCPKVFHFLSQTKENGRISTVSVGVVINSIRGFVVEVVASVNLRTVIVHKMRGQHQQKT